MKKINLMIIAILAGAMAFMTSCDGGGEVITPKPVITFTSDHSGVVMAGDSVDVVGNVEAEGSIAKITFFKGDDQYGEAITKDFNTKTTHTFSVRVAGDETFNFEVQVEDKEAQITKKSVTITVDESIVKYSGLKMFCATADQTGHGDYASLTVFRTWNHTQAKASADTIALIDVWYYNASWTKELGGHPRFVSPDTKTETYDTHLGDVLTDAKTTELLVLDDASAFDNWASIENDDAIKVIDMTSSGHNVEFALNNVIAFKLADGKMGVMKAVGGTDGDGGNDFVIVDVIVQKHAPAATK